MQHFSFLYCIVPYVEEAHSQMANGTLYKQNVYLHAVSDNWGEDHFNLILLKVYCQFPSFSRRKTG
jgi:hypothetical protein